MSYIHITKTYPRFLAGAFLLTFFSGLGQSFFISIFTPYFLETLSIGQGVFGSIYSVATLLSGFLLIWFGSLLDRVNTRRYTHFAVCGLAAFCFILAGMNSVFVFAIAIFGLRLCGQGLFSHISATLVARGFLSYRGRALSLSGLGHPASEAVLPVVTAFLNEQWNWRLTWALYGAILILFFLPTISYLLKGKVENSNRHDLKSIKSASQIDFRHFPDFLKLWKYWFLVTGVILPGSILTGLFLYHGLLAEQKNWSMVWMASGFIWFAVSQIIFSLISGELLDRFGVKNLFAVHLIPLALGLSVLALGLTTKWLLPCYLMLAGVTAGLSSPLKTALWTEVFGTEKIATVRSWGMAVAVIGTAISPLALGLVFEAGFGFSVFLRASAILIFFYSLLSFLIRRKVFYIGP